MEVGDQVWSYDGETDTWAWRPVVKTFVHDHEGMGHLRIRERGARLSVGYRVWIAPAPRHELVATAAAGLVQGLSLGVLALHGPRAGWSGLWLDHAARERLVAPDPQEAWLLGVQLRADLGILAGVPCAVWVDALNLADHRGPLGVAAAGPDAAGAPLRVPPRQLRLGLRVEL